MEFLRDLHNVFLIEPVFAITKLYCNTHGLIGDVARRSDPVADRTGESHTVDHLAIRDFGGVIQFIAEQDNFLFQFWIAFEIFYDLRSDFFSLHNNTRLSSQIFSLNPLNSQIMGGGPRLCG